MKLRQVRVRIRASYNLRVEAMTMNEGVTYTNRKGVLYHLGRGETKTGKPRYFFSRRGAENPVVRIPDGFEIAESVNGIVSLRGLGALLIRQEELRLVRSELGRHARAQGHRADAAGNTLTVYEPVGFLESMTRYSPVMRFVLTDRDSREFTAQRMCYRSSMYGWIDIGGGLLGDMARAYVPHLGQETFFELFAWTGHSKLKKARSSS